MKGLIFLFPNCVPEQKTFKSMYLSTQELYVLTFAQPLELNMKVYDPPLWVPTDPCFLMWVLLSTRDIEGGVEDFSSPHTSESKPQHFINGETHFQ